MREREPSMKHSTVPEDEAGMSAFQPRASPHGGQAAGRTVLAVLEQLFDVLLDDGAVQWVVAECPADEEGSALGEHRADDGHVEVLAGDDVRQGESETEEEPRDGCEDGVQVSKGQNVQDLASSRLTEVVLRERRTGTGAPIVSWVCAVNDRVGCLARTM